MLTASEELRQFLTDMPTTDLLTLLNNVAVVHAHRQDDGNWDISWRRGIRYSKGKFDQDSDALRLQAKQFIGMAIETQHTAPEQFAHLCHETGIMTDAARKLDLQGISSEAAADAAQSAKISATASAASEKHAAKSNQIAVKANRFSLLSLIVAVGALAVAIWALFAKP